MDPYYSDLSIRLADLSDYHALSVFLNTEPQVHRHLDWRSGLDWLGFQPFIIAEHNHEIIGVLACPPDPPEIAWVRIFCCPDYYHRKDIWKALIEKALEVLPKNPPATLAAISLQEWFAGILQSSGFLVHQQIVVLEWTGKVPPNLSIPKGVRLRAMNEKDLEMVAHVDHNAFAPLWQNSLETLHLAFRQSAHATVIEDDSGIIAYQISTSVSINGHLARLAVLPRAQHQNLGYTLVRELLAYFSRINAWRVTVNTQADNHSSLALYKKTGFSETGETFNVYTRNPVEKGEEHKPLTIPRQLI